MLFEAEAAAGGNRGVALVPVSAHGGTPARTAWMDAGCLREHEPWRVGHFRAEVERYRAAETGPVDSYRPRPSCRRPVIS
jgi:hypothetical protein